MAKDEVYALERGRQVADQVLELIEGACVRCEVAGSIRRQAAWVHDVDIVCLPVYDIVEEYDLFGHLVKSTAEPVALAEALTDRMRLPGDVVRSGMRICRFKWDELPVELYLAEPGGENYHALLQMRTGPTGFNVALINRAKQLGLTYKAGFGIYRGFERVDNWRKGEQAIFDALQLAYLSPDRRRG